MCVYIYIYAFVHTHTGAYMTTSLIRDPED